MWALQVNSFFLISSTFSYLVFAQSQNVQFNQVINLNGDMQLNTLIFPDNSKIETFSQTQRQILVNQNTSPLTANHVVGSTGQPFVQLSQSAMTIETNNATDLVGAQIELAIDQGALDQNGITADNTFVAKLSPDRQAWMVMEGVKSVNTTDQTVRMIKMSNIDGEYMAIGRKTVETGNVVSPFGQSAQQSVNITGSGIQEVEFQDGFRMAVQATQPMTVNTDVINGVSSSMITNGAMPVNNYRYLVTSNLAGVNPGLNQMMTVIQIPINAQRVMDMAVRSGAGGNSTVNLSVAQRVVLQNPGGAVGNLPSQPQKRQKGKASSSTGGAAKETSAPSSTAPAADAEAAPSAPAESSPAAASSSGEPAADAQSAVETSASSSGDPATATGAASASNDTTPAASSGASAPATQTPQASTGQTGSTTQPQNSASSPLLLAPTFNTVQGKTVLDMTGGRVATTVNELDGEFILTMGMTGATGGSSLEAAQGGISVSMAELKIMAEQQQNGGILPVWSMMAEARQSQPKARTVQTRSRRVRV